MRTRLGVIVALAVVLAAPARAEVRSVAPFPLEQYAGRGAVGLYVAGDEPFRGGTAPAGATVYVGVPPPGTEPGRRYPVAVVGADARGVLTSDSTRLRGLVTQEDVERNRLEWRSDDGAAETVGRLDRRIERNDDLRQLLTVVFLTIVIALALVRPRVAPRALLVGLALNLWLSPMLALAGALAAVVLPLGPACAAVLAVYLAALGLDPQAVALSPLGASQVHRFYGLNNLLETLLLLPAFLGAALVGRWGVLVAVLSIVTVAGNRFGADGGGLLVLLAGYGVLGLRLAGGRLTRARAAVLAAGVVAAALLLVGLDAATGGSSHVTDAIGDGPAALAGDLADRIDRSVERTLDAPGALVVVVIFLGVLGWAVTKHGEPVLDALLVALAVSLVVNDTPSDVVAAGAACAVVLVRLGAAPYARSATLAGSADDWREPRAPPGRADVANRQPARAGEPPR